MNLKDIKNELDKLAEVEEQIQSLNMQIVCLAGTVNEIEKTVSRLHNKLLEMSSGID